MLVIADFIILLKNLSRTLSNDVLVFLLESILNILQLGGECNLQVFQM